MARIRKSTRAEKEAAVPKRPVRGSITGIDRQDILLLPALVLATLVAYQPAWRGGLLWDDDGHITPAPLRSVSGLWQIWFHLGATQQYYPVTHSMFWLLYRLFGEQTLAYHLANIVLHSASAFLVFVILRQLRIRGAAMAAGIFALHPVQVESVAWISELKNTLSGFLCLSALLTYLGYYRSRRPGAYAGALLLFSASVLSKSVTATLPFILLIVLWLKEDKPWRRHNVVPLMPFVAIGLAVGAVTVWVERSLIGANGSEFSLSTLQRSLIASRAVCA